MKTLRVALVLTVAAWILMPAFASAEGWGMPNLNPFAKKGRARTSVSVSDAPTSGWKWPKLWPSTSTTTVKPRTSRAAPPSTWQKMTAGTKNVMSKTADVLNPFDDADDQRQQPRVTGSNTYFSQASKKKESKSRSFLPSWPWGGQEEDTGPKDVNSFLSQERPDF